MPVTLNLAQTRGMSWPGALTARRQGGIGAAGIPMEKQQPVRCRATMNAQSAIIRLATYHQRELNALASRPIGHSPAKAWYQYARDSSSEVTEPTAHPSGQRLLAQADADGCPGAGECQER